MPQNHAKYALLISLITVIIAGCTSVPDTASPAITTEVSGAATVSMTVAATQQPSAFDLSEYAFPQSIDAAEYYLFYLHGKIIEDQGIPAISPDFGEYEYQAILEKLASSGFVVISEQRPKDTDAIAYAQKVQKQITTLLNGGVPAENITVVGASKGAVIAVYISHLLANQNVHFVLMSGCNSESLADFETGQVSLYGKALSIYDFADEAYAGSCEKLFNLSEVNGGLTQKDEIVLHVGTGHGILYKPLDDWIDPVIQWSGKPSTR